MLSREWQTATLTRLGVKKFTREQKLEDSKEINLSAVNVGERDTK